MKQVIKQLYATTDKASAEREFEQELRQGITTVNSFFIEKERQLLSELPKFDGSTVGQGGTHGEESVFFGAVSDLYHCAILNSLAVLKIVKKHDKHSRAPLRNDIVETLFAQAFYLSLEHSYLFSACAKHSNGAVSSTSRTSTHGNASFSGDALRYFTGKHETLEVPQHLIECCMSNGGIVGAPLDFSMLRTDAASRGVEVQIETLLTLAGSLASFVSHNARDTTVAGGSCGRSGRLSPESAAADEGSMPRAAVATPPRPISPLWHIRKETSAEMDDGCFGCDDGPTADFLRSCSVPHESASVVAPSGPSSARAAPAADAPSDEHDAALAVVTEHARSLMSDFEGEDEVFKIEE